jgi:hypothetical protein
VNYSGTNPRGVPFACNGGRFHAQFLYLYRLSSPRMIDFLRTTPVVADGKVFVATTYTVAIFGLLQ